MFPVLFARGRYEFRTERSVPITLQKYVNAMLINYQGTFETNPDHVFFSTQFIVERRNLFENIYIALRKVHGSRTTAK